MQKRGKQTEPNDLAELRSKRLKLRKLQYTELTIIEERVVQRWSSKDQQRTPLNFWLSTIWTCMRGNNPKAGERIIAKQWATQVLEVMQDQ